VQWLIEKAEASRIARRRSPASAAGGKAGPRALLPPRLALALIPGLWATYLGLSPTLLVITQVLVTSILLVNPFRFWLIILVVSLSPCGCAGGGSGGLAFAALRTEAAMGLEARFCIRLETPAGLKDPMTFSLWGSRSLAFADAAPGRGVRRDGQATKLAWLGQSAACRCCSAWSPALLGLFGIVTIVAAALPCLPVRASGVVWIPASLCRSGRRRSRSSRLGASWFELLPRCRLARLVASTGWDDKWRGTAAGPGGQQLPW
jgi:hypothetical protein